MIRRSLLVARTTLRRRIRRALGRPKRTALTVALFLFPLVSLVLPGEFGGIGATFDGTTVSADGESIRLVALFESMFSLFWLVAFFGAAFNVDADVGEIDAGGLLVRAGSVPTTVRGRELAGHARRVTLFGIWFVVGAGTIALGGGGIAVLPVGAVGFLLLLLSASVTGRAAGLFARRAVLDRGYSVRRAGMAAAGVLFGATMLAASRTDVLLETVRRLPTAWFAEWLLFELTDSVRVGRLFGSLALAVGATVVGFRAYERLAADLWFRTPGDGGEVDRGDGSGLFRGIARRVADGPTAALAWSVARRRLRNPGYVVAVVLVGALFWHDLTLGLPSAIRPVFAGAYLVAVLPGAVALNPLADEGPVLPMLLRSGLSGRGFVAGYALAAAGFAGVLAAAATLVLVAVDGAVGVPAAVAVVVTPLLAFETGCLAVAAGSTIPNADADTVVASEGVTLPSSYAAAAYLPVVALVLVPLLAAALLDGRDTALLAGAAGSVLLGCLAVAGALRIAAPRFETFVLE